jgi:predicted DNA-binding transcriptional regulator YafY
MPKAGRKAGNYAQAHRILNLLESLRSRRYGATYVALAEEFSVTERQIRRDLEVIDDAGYDLKREIGGDGRVAVKLAAAQARAVRLGQRERFGLLAARRVFDVLKGTAFEKDVATVFDKLVRSFPEDEAKEIERFGERFVFVPEGGVKSYPDDADDDNDTLNGLLTGTMLRRRVRYRYRTAGGELHQGLLGPYAMAVYKQGIYVVGVAEKEGEAAGRSRRPHVYAVERFEEAEQVRGSNFEVPKSFRADRFFDGAFGIFVGDETEHVIVDFAPAVKHLVQARRWHRTQKLTTRTDGWVRVEFDACNLTEVHSWLLSWGPQVRVRGPESLVERMRREVAGLAKMYGSRAIFESAQSRRPAGKRNPERRDLLGVLHFWRNGAGMRGVVALARRSPSCASRTREAASRWFAGVAKGVLGGPFSRRIGLTRPGAFYSATGG